MATSKERLVNQALEFKKAWLLCRAWLGQPVPDDAATIPAYATWTKQSLFEHIALLHQDFEDAISQICEVKGKKAVDRSAAWMARQFDRWLVKGCGVMTHCTAHEFESVVGQLRAHDYMEVPPYAELCQQGLAGLAFRHPEYMLGRDLAFLHNLYLDSEHLIASYDDKEIGFGGYQELPSWLPHAGENQQALARAVILTCFNLVEAFVSGIARAHVMLHPDLPNNLRDRILDNKRPLRKRVIQVPNDVAGRSSGLDINKPPVSTLFGALKEHRDSFVHCEPGQHESSRGYIKETKFHDVRSEVIDAAIENTLGIIRHVWEFLYDSEQPRWLPSKGSDGRFMATGGGRREESADLRLRPPEVELGEN